MYCWTKRYIQERLLCNKNPTATNQVGVQYFEPLPDWFVMKYQIMNAVAIVVQDPGSYQEIQTI